MNTLIKIILALGFVPLAACVPADMVPKQAEPITAPEAESKRVQSRAREIRPTEICMPATVTKDGVQYRTWKIHGKIDLYRGYQVFIAGRYDIQPSPFVAGEIESLVRLVMTDVYQFREGIDYEIGYLSTYQVKVTLLDTRTNYTNPLLYDAPSTTITESCKSTSPFNAVNLDE